MPHRICCVSVLLICGLPTTAAEPTLSEPVLKLHAVSVPLQSYRLLSMTRDDDGFIWSGSIHRCIHRYDPQSGTAETTKLPYDAVACSCICVGKKVYVLGQTYPKLIVYDQEQKAFTEFTYPTAKPDVWYGSEAMDGKHLFLFDRNGGIIRWDTETDTGKVIPWPYQAPFPLGGRYEPRDGAIWCQSFDLTDGQYVPLGMSRLDVKTATFTGWFPYPQEGQDLKPFSDPDQTFFVPETLKGKLIPFDFNDLRWCKSLEAPSYGKRFGFIGVGTLHEDRWYFSLSTYDGDDIGCDGKPYHFVNGLLEFNPSTSTFAFPTLDSDAVPAGPSDAYYQVAYALSVDGEFFAPGANIREPDESLNQAKAGEVVFWQTVKPVEE